MDIIYLRIFAIFGDLPLLSFWFPFKFQPRESLVAYFSLLQAKVASSLLDSIIVLWQKENFFLVWF